MVMKDDHVRGARVSFYIDPAVCGGKTGMWRPSWRSTRVTVSGSDLHVANLEMRFYKYEPLKAKNIRLIEPKASSTCNYSTELPVCIPHASLNDSKASYEAFRTHGRPYRSAPIVLQRRPLSNDHEKPFSALSSLRWRDRSR
jgi:hypothetical protein